MWRSRAGQWHPFGASEPKQPSIGLKDVLFLLGTVASLALTAARPDVPSWAFVAPLGFLVVLLGSVSWPWVAPQAIAWWHDRRRHKRLLQEWQRFQSFQHRLHDLLRHDSARGVRDPLQKLLELECQGQPPEITREKQERYRILVAHMSFASQFVAQLIEAAGEAPKSFEAGRRLAWQFQETFTSLDHLGIISAFNAAKATAGHEGWYTEWFDRMRRLVLDYETFAAEANRRIGEHVFWVHIRMA